MSKVQTSALVLLCMSTLWLVGMRHIPPGSADARIIDDFRAIPLRMGNWVSTPGESIVKMRQSVLPTSSVLDRVYSDGQGNKANVTIVYCTSLGDLHQPEMCLGGQGWSAADASSPSLHPKGESPFSTTMSWVQNEATGEDSVALYWFNSSLVKDTLLPWFKVKVYWSRVRGVELQSVALVRIIVPTGGNPDRAKKAAVDFATQASPYIDRMMSRPPVTEGM
jgi:EpsI family protein